MKRANRRLLSMASRNEYTAQSKQWRSHLQWMRFHLAYFKPLPPALRGHRIRQRNYIDLLMAMAEEGIKHQGYAHAEPEKLRRILRMFARYSPRGRIPIFHLRYMLDNCQSRKAQIRIVEFIEKRITLRGASDS